MITHESPEYLEFKELEARVAKLAIKFQGEFKRQKARDLTKCCNLVKFLETPDNWSALEHIPAALLTKAVNNGKFKYHSIPFGCIVTVEGVKHLYSCVKDEYINSEDLDAIIYIDRFTPAVMLELLKYLIEERGISANVFAVSDIAYDDACIKYLMPKLDANHDRRYYFGV